MSWLGEALAAPRLHFWSFFAGFNLTFFPQFLGLSGMPQRIADYSGIDRWTPLNLISTVGATLTALSILPFVWNVLMSLRKGKLAGDDPWEGNSLEWATTSPPPHHNFHHLPEIHSERPVFDLRHGLNHPEAGDHTDPQTKPQRG